MNDDELPQSAETASAYLDGELDADERASAAADPDTMAMVDSFAQVRVVLGEPPPVVGSARTAAISAALAEFDRMHAAPAVATARPPLAAPGRSWRPRRLRPYRVLTGFAAAGIVIVIGMAALNSTGSDSKTSSATQPREAADSATAVPAAAGVPAAKSAETTAAASAETAVLGGSALPSASAIAAVPSIDSAEALKQYATNLAVADSAQSSVPAATTVVPLASTQAPVSGDYAVPACVVADQIVLGAISFQGTPAFAVRDTTSGVVQAIDAFDCRVLVSVAP